VPIAILQEAGLFEGLEDVGRVEFFENTGVLELLDGIGPLEHVEYSCLIEIFEDAVLFKFAELTGLLAQLIFDYPIGRAFCAQSVLVGPANTDDSHRSKEGFLKGLGRREAHCVQHRRSVKLADDRLVLGGTKNVEPHPRARAHK
jgi:hypothetical protein